MSPLIVTLYFHPEPTGSAPPITDLAQWIAERGLQPEVLTARPNYPDRVVFDGYRKGERDRENWEGVNIRRVSGYVSRGSGVIGRLATEGSFCLAMLWRRVFRRSTDRVISVCPSIFTALVAGFFVAAGGRHLVIVHDIQSGLGAATGASRLAMTLLRILERWTLNRADALVTLSSGMENALREMGVTTPIVVAPPQIDVRRFAMLPDPGRRTAVYSGAMGRKQGLHQVLDAAEVLKRRGSDIVVIIRGQGGIKDELVQSAHARGLDNVVFEPLAPADQLNQAMAAGSVHLVPQAAEGADFAVPSKIFSIMACGRPFIATASEDAPLANFAEASGAGVCVPPDEPELFADALEKLMADEALRCQHGASGRAYVEKHVDRSVVCDQIWKAVDQDLAQSDLEGTEA